MSSNLFFGYDNSLLFFETYQHAPEIEENFLIKESSSFLPPKSELELSFSSADEFMQSYYCQNELNFDFDFDGALLESARYHLLDSPESSIEEVSTNSLVSVLIKS